MTEELDCSDGMKMLIARMESNPEEFKAGGKFQRLIDISAKRIAGHISTNDSLSLRDAQACLAKYETMAEQWLTEFVIKAVMEPPKEELSDNGLKAALNKVMQSQVVQQQLLTGTGAYILGAGGGGGGSGASGGNGLGGENRYGFGAQPNLLTSTQQEPYPRYHPGKSPLFATDAGTTTKTSWLGNGDVTMWVSK